MLKKELEECRKLYDKKLLKKLRIKWDNMFYRAYHINYHLKHPTYKDVTVCEEWKCFQNFAEWCSKHIKEGYCLDKDILIKGNKSYSPETCCFVPNEINMLLVKSNKRRGKLPIGVNKNGNKYQASRCINRKRFTYGTFNTPEEAFECYKFHKEAHIKEVADKWKDLIDPRVYEALINYNVEITD
mgnify:CR=1 FL=1